MGAIRLVVFISSPGDVGQERLLTTRVLERLQGEFGNRLELWPVLWEHEPLRATEHFQEQIVLPSQTDIVICILWSRLGTRLPDGFQRPDGSGYLSGTEWEFEDAIRAFQTKGTPDLLVYRRLGDPLVALSDEQSLLERLQQKKALETFIDRWFGNPQEGFKAAFHTFHAPDEFESLLEVHLRHLLTARLPSQPGGDGEQAAVKTWLHDSPFRGLEAFEYEHAPIFFGRTQAIGNIKDALVRQAARGCSFVLILGMSGGGKSSLVRAGVLPTITQPGVVEGIGLWRWTAFRPSDATGGLCEALGSAITSPGALPECCQQGLDARELGALLAEAPKRAGAPLRAALRRAAENVAQKENLPRPPEARLAILIDQMEEIFTLEPRVNAAERERFVAALSALARSGAVWIIATMRSDFYPRCGELPELVAMKDSGGQYDVLPPQFAEIAQMIVQPARAAGLKYQVDPATGQRLDAVLHEAAARDPRALPLLEFALDELYHRRTSDGVLTFEAYEQLGRLEGAIGQRAEEVFNRLGPEAQAALAPLMRGLVTIRPGESNTITAIRAALTDLANTRARKALIDALVAARLLVTDRGNDGTAVVGLAHESLLEHWPRLKRLLAQDADFLLVRARVAQAAARWRAEGENPEFLLPPGKPLAEAEDMLLDRRDDVSAENAAFVTASAAYVHRARRRRLIAIATTTVFFFVVVSGFAAFSAVQWGRAEDRRREADKQTGIAQTQTALAESRQKTAEESQTRAEKAQQAEAVAHRNETAQRLATESALRLAERNLQFNRVALAARDWEANDGGQARQLLDAYPVEMRQWEWNYVNRLCHGERIALLHDGFVFSAAFSPNAAQLVTTSGPLYENGGDVRIWGTETGRLVCIFKKHNETPRQAIFVSGGKQVLSASNDEVILWNAQDASIVKRVPLGSFRPEAITFNNDGSLVAVADNSATDLIHIHIYRVPDGTEVRAIDVRAPQPQSRPTSASDSSDPRPARVYIDVTGMAFSRDGRRLATIHNQRSIKLWDLENGQQLREFSAGDTIMFEAAFSDDGTQLACGRLDGTTPVWDTNDGRRLFILGGHTSAVSHVVFSGDRIATASWDQSAKIWDAKTGVELFTIRGHANWVMSVGFSRSGGSIVTSSWDRTAKIWDGHGEGVIPKRLDNSLHWIDGLAFHPRGRSIADVRIDESVWVWTIKSGIPDATFTGQRFAAYNGDGSLLATGGAGDKGNLLQIFESEGGNDPKLICRGHEAKVLAAAFRPGSSQIASASQDGAIKVWDAQGHEVFTCRGHSGGVEHVVYSADGRWIVSGGVDKTVRIWDAGDGHPIRVFEGHPAGVRSVAVSTDKSRVAAAGGEFNHPGQATVWDAETGKQIWALKGHSDDVPCVLFSRNGKRIFTASYDKSIKIWDADTGQEALTLRAHAREVTALALSANGNLLASAGRDGTVRIWDGTPLPAIVATPPAPGPGSPAASNSASIVELYALVSAPHWNWQLATPSLEYRTLFDLLSTATTQFGR
jgi:WD40 repeat protein